MTATPSISAPAEPPPRDIASSRPSEGAAAPGGAPSLQVSVPITPD